MEVIGHMIFKPKY